MQQGNQYHRFGYQPFNEQTPPQQNQGHQSYEQTGSNFDEVGRARGAGLVSLVSSPLVMTGSLIVAAVIFAGIVMVSYPSSDDIPQPIPIVQAEAGPLKSAPEDVGGMEIANRDTTVFDAVEAGFEGGKPVENLLESAAAEEAPMTKAELLAKLKVQEAANDIPAEISEDLKEPSNTDTAAESVAETAPEVVEEKLIEAAEASAKGIPLPRPALHEPGASPDTIAFVRSVLDKKDGKTGTPVAAAAPAPKDIFEAEPQAPEAIEPAAGAATAPDPVAPAPSQAVKPASVPAVSSASGTHYVQMVSVPSKSAAEAEWSKIQKNFSSILSGSSHRIQEANLGEKGTFYRVQVGPYSEAAAKSLCEQVKAQKPGGCLVVR